MSVKVKKGFSSASLLVSGNLLSRVGTIVFDVALAWWVTEATGSSEYLGYILASSMIAIVITSPFSGVLTDQWNKKYILVFSDLISGFLCTIVGYLAYINYLNVYLLIVLSFSLGLCTSIFRPAMKSIIPDIVDKSELLRVNSLITNITELSRILGPVMAGILLAVNEVGVAGAFVINGVSYIISAILEMFISYDSKPKISNFNFFNEFKSGIHYIVDDKLLLTLLILISLVNFFLSTFTLLMPLYVQNILNESTNYFTAILATTALGGIVVTIFFMIKKNYEITFIKMAISLLFTGLFYSAFTLFDLEGLLFLFVFLYGLSLSSFNAMFFSYIQTKVEKEMLGRVFSVVYMMAIVSVPISYVVFGHISKEILDYVFVLSGVPIVLMSLYCISVFKRDSQEIIIEGV